MNLGGTREILEVAALCRSLRCLVFHSTALVSGTRTGLVLESDLDEGQAHRNVVEETLARAERTLRDAMSRMPICVVRPTIIVGDARTGEVDRTSGFYSLALLLVSSPADLTLPIVGRGDTFLNLVPIDYVVRAAVALGRDPRAPGRTFHVGDPSPLTARRVFELVAAASGRPAAKSHFPANLTKALLRTPGIDRFARSPRAFLDALATPVTYSFANTNELLSGTDVRCPPFESYASGLALHVQAHLNERRAPRDVEDAAVLDPLV
jgi:nucleoside-diphosphate-sugar epimerase